MLHTHPPFRNYNLDNLTVFFSNFSSSSHGSERYLNLQHTYSDLWTYITVDVSGTYTWA